MYGPDCPNIPFLRENWLRSYTRSIPKVRLQVLKHPIGSRIHHGSYKGRAPLEFQANHSSCFEDVDIYIGVG